MRTFFLQLFLELRLLYKMRWPLLLPLPAGAWMLLQCISISDSPLTDINLFAVDAHKMLMILLPAVPILLGVLLIRRDALNASYEWMLGLPIPNAVIIASKWTAAFLYASLFTIFLQAVYVLIAWQQDQFPASLIWNTVIYYSIFYEMSFAASAALGIVLGALMPLRFSLAIGFCGWVFGTLFLPGLLVRSLGLYPLKAFSLNHFLDEINDFTWTSSLNDHEYLLMQVFVASFSLFMLAAANALLARVRPVNSPRLPLVMMCLTLVLSAAAYIPYGKLWLDRFDSLHRMEAAAPQPNTAQQQELYTFKMESMRLDMTRLPDNNLYMKAEVTLPTRDGLLIPAASGIQRVKEHFPGQVSFLLDPGLQMDSLTVDGNSVPWKRSGDFISFPIDSLSSTSDRHRIAFIYGGVINQWKLRYNSESYAAFVHDGSALLPGFAGWFPLPGGYSLLTDKEALVSRADLTENLRADFNLTLRGFDGPLYASLEAAPDDQADIRHFIGHSVAAPTLFGGPFSSVTRPDEPITIITTPGNKKESRLFLESLHEKRLYFESWSKQRLDTIKQIAYISNIDQLSGLSGQNLYVSGHTVFVNSMRYQTITGDEPSILSQLLFGDTVNSFEHVNEWNDYTNPYDSYSMVQEIRMAILNLPQIEQMAPFDSSFLIPLNSDAAPAAVSMQKMINNAFINGQGDIVKRVLLHFLKQGLFIKDRYSNLIYLNGEASRQARYIYPVITWRDWLQVWNEEKAGENE
ncbi:ABC transporter permease [Paenibacillus solisilvae]|uniref:ABC transporter permease n=1 Tax=Paenibacillus solisilvae TaxID=2486751 RepID=A0ABW0VRQ5_9BACL